MIDSLGGPVKVNNMLSTLNMPTISNKNMKKMERRAGNVIEKVALMSTRTTAKETFDKEMADLRHEESKVSEQNMEDLIEDLGVCPLPDASPALKSILQLNATVSNDSDWSDLEDWDGPSSKKIGLHASDETTICSIPGQSNAHAKL